MENYDPWFIRIQPAMTVPAMKYTTADGEETIVGDSKDILYFLAERHPGLTPLTRRKESRTLPSSESTCARAEPSIYSSDACATRARK